MKFKIFLGVFLLGLFASSCFEDESAKDLTLFNPLMINDFLSSTEIYVTQGDRLRVKVLAYKEGTDDAKLEYEWRCGMHYVRHGIRWLSGTWNKKDGSPSFC